jgi:hypothetical protein
MFNAIGGLLIYPFPPIRKIPLAMARGLGTLGSRNRPAAIAYVLTVFFGLPILFLFLSGAFRSDQAPPARPPDPVPVEAPAETGPENRETPEDPAADALLIFVEEPLEDTHV